MKIPEVVYLDAQSRIYSLMKEAVGLQSEMNDAEKRFQDSIKKYQNKYKDIDPYIDFLVDNYNGDNPEKEQYRSELKADIVDHGLK